MKVAKIVGLLLVACSLFPGLQAMDQSYAAEERLLKGSFSTEMYFSSLGARFVGMVNELRDADYSQSLDGNYYEQLINPIDNMVDAIRRNQLSEALLKSLKLKIKRFIRFYYNELKNAKDGGFVRDRRAT